MIDSLNGKAGTRWGNGTGRARYQLVVDWHNSCGVCIQYDHAVGLSWPIPFHFNCRCKQLFIPPGGESEPFVDFRRKLDALPASAKARAVGASNWRLIRKGLAGWNDVVTEGRVRDFREVVSRKKLTVDQLTRAGVRRAVAERAHLAVHTQAHTLAEEARLRLFAAMAAKGATRDEARRAVAERLAARVSIGSGPSGPQASPVRPFTPFRPLAPAAVAEALGVKLTRDAIEAARRQAEGDEDEPK